MIKQEREVSLNINIKCRKDSIIWASISAPLGIELFRIQISKDSIYFINRSNKTYFLKPISHIRDYLKTEISFSEINEMRSKVTSGEYPLAMIKFRNGGTYASIEKKYMTRSKITS